jgi:type I restriction enzyme S subunit
MTCELPDGWEEKRLAECGVWLSGGTPAKSRPEFWGGRIPWVGPKDLHVDYVDDAEERVTDLGVANGTRIAPAASILIVVRSMALGKRLQIGMARREVAFNQDIKAIVPSEDLEPRFLLYALWASHDSLHQLVDEASHGTKRLRTQVLGEFRIPVPPRQEQRQIAEVLGALDDKIASNRRLAVLLEETAATMFRARFVHFVGENQFAETELGRVPRDWTVAPIGDLVKVVGGSTPSTKESRYWDGGTHCWATPKDLSGATSSVLLDTARHITDDGVGQISSRLLPERTVLLSSRAPVGYTALSMVQVAVNQGFIAIPPSDSVPSEYVLMWLRENRDRIKAHAGGTTFAEISKRAFRPLLMTLPPASVLAEFEHATRPMFDVIAGQEREIQALSRIRDALLPRLVSGEIRVPDTRDYPDALDALGEEVIV